MSLLEKHNVGDLFLHSYTVNEGFRVHRLGMVVKVLDYGNNFPMYKVVWADTKMESMQSLYSHSDIQYYKEGLENYMGKTDK